VVLQRVRNLFFAADPEARAVVEELGVAVGLCFVSVTASAPYVIALHSA
jgi:hypothetical protein